MSGEPGQEIVRSGAYPVCIEDRSEGGQQAGFPIDQRPVAVEREGVDALEGERGQGASLPMAMLDHRR